MRIEPGCVELAPRWGNHCSGSVSFFGAFKTNPSVCSLSAILLNLTDIIHCMVFIYLVDIKEI